MVCLQTYPCLPCMCRFALFCRLDIRRVWQFASALMEPDRGRAWRLGDWSALTTPRVSGILMDFVHLSLGCFGWYMLWYLLYCTHLYTMSPELFSGFFWSAGDCVLWFIPMLFHVVPFFCSYICWGCVLQECVSRCEDLLAGRPAPCQAMGMSNGIELEYTWVYDVKMKKVTGIHRSLWFWFSRSSPTSLDDVHEIKLFRRKHGRSFPNLLYCLSRALSPGSGLHLSWLARSKLPWWFRLKMTAAQATSTVNCHTAVPNAMEQHTPRHGRHGGCFPSCFFQCLDA